MVKSMTGYGRGQVTGNGREITVEVKSVNHRYFDCSIRTPRGCAFLEEPVKAKVSEKIARGKVDVYISVDASKGDNVTAELAEPILKAYLDIADTISKQYGIENDLTVSKVMRLPDVVTITKEEADAAELQAEVLAALKEALIMHTDMSVTEGINMCVDFYLRLNAIEELVGKIEERSPQCVSEYREKLEARMREVLSDTQIEPARIVTEAAIFADKIAVAEETVRLRSHIAQARELFTEGGIIGRKLDFLTQEFNREANTIGSKANDVIMAQYVVDLKSEIEKFRENIQNII